MTRLVQFLVVEALIFPVFLWRNDDFLSGFVQRNQDALSSVIGFVSPNGWDFKGGQKQVRPIQIARLSGRQTEAGRMAQSIGRRALSS